MREDIASTNPKTPRVVWMLSPPSAKIKRTRMSPARDFPIQSNGSQFDDMDGIFGSGSINTDFSPPFPSTPTLSCIFQNEIDSNNSTKDNSNFNTPSSPLLDSLMLCVPGEDLECYNEQLDCQLENDIYSDSILDPEAIKILDAVNDNNCSDKDPCFDTEILCDDLLHVDIESISQTVNECKEDEWFSSASTQIEQLLTCSGRDYLRFQTLQSISEVK